MSLLRSLFSFRDQSHGAGDAEKPFLDHLEDLRVTLMKMGTVLVIAMIGAFCFRNDLTALLQRPLQAVVAAAQQQISATDAAHTERGRLLAELAAISLLSAEKLTGKSIPPEERAQFAKDVANAYPPSKPGDALDPLSRLLASTSGTAEQGMLQNLEVTESFGIAMKLAFYAGIVLSFPFLLYFVVGFVLPALTRKEKRLLGPGIAAGSVLFGAGVWVGFQFILPKTLVWFDHFGRSMGFASNWKAGTYFSFVTQLCLACGLLCELPLVMVVLSVLNVISFAMLQATRRYAVAIILVIVAIIAPTPDPITFFTLAVPMLAIFEGSIWLVWLIERNRRNQESSED